MSSILVVLVSHNELSRRGKSVLLRMLTSIQRARELAAHKRPDLDIFVACCDDASSDATPDIIARHFDHCSWFKLVRQEAPRYAGFCRNVAAAQFNTDFICLLDADDEYLERHFVACRDLMCEQCDEAGQQFAVGYTSSTFNVLVHPDWIPRLNWTITLTKVIRRSAWDFVEGFPSEGIYSMTTLEDQFLMRKLTMFFPTVHTSEVTTKYYCYPGSAFERQLAKFFQPFEAAAAQREMDPKLLPAHQIRTEVERNFLNYLQRKLQLPQWQQRLSGLITSVPQDFAPARE